MKDNTVKTHLVLHIHDDVLNFGVPEVMNSSYAESGHITICKNTARNTQKRSNTFTIQAAMRYVENLAIHRGFAAIEDHPGSTNVSSNTSVAKLKGKRFIISKDSNGKILCHRHRSSKKALDSLSQAFPLDKHVLETLASHCLPHVHSQMLHCYTEYHPESGGQLYRAHPCYNGKPWYDHVFVRWKDKNGNTTLHPSRIHAFVDLHNIVPRAVINFPHSQQDGHFTKPAFYAVIESYDAVKIPCVQKTNKDADYDFSIFHKFRLSLMPNSIKPILYLVQTDFIVGPTVAIPDAFGDAPPKVGGASIPNVDYIVLTHRQREWAETWESFIICQEHKVNGPDGVESNDSDYAEEESEDDVCSDGDDDHFKDVVEEKRVANLSRNKRNRRQIEQPHKTTQKRQRQRQK
jgi:hypothetical protein